MRNTLTARRAKRLLAAAFAFGLAGLVSGCGSMSMPSWDPTDLLDFLDTKKRAPGERKPVFPEGVPGVTQGVPKDMIRGSAEARAAADAQAAAAAPPPEPPPPAAKQSRGTKSAARGSPPAQAKQGQVEIAPDDVNVEEESMPPTPPPPQRPKQARTRTTAPPPDPAPQQQGSPFPPPR